MEDQLSAALRIYQNLLASNLVVTQIASDDNIASFQQILDGIDLKNEMVKNVRSLLKCQYDTNKTAFYNYLKISGQQYLTLFTNGGPLAKMLNVHNLVLIKYQWQQQGFKVSKHVHNRTLQLQLGHNTYPIMEKKKRITRVIPGEYEHMISSPNRAEHMIGGPDRANNTKHLGANLRAEHKPEYRILQQTLSTNWSEGSSK